MGTEQPQSAERQGITQEQRDLIMVALGTMIDGAVGPRPTEEQVDDLTARTTAALAALDASGLWALEYMLETVQPMIPVLALRLIFRRTEA